eukprot:jgi/Mesen1/971/ME000012S00522
MSYVKVICCLLLCSSILCLEAANPAEVAGMMAENEQGSCGWNVDDKCPDGQSFEGEFFRNIPAIKYAGPESRELYAYRYYNAEENIMGKPMKEWLSLSVAFWHTFRGDGSDPFGSATKSWPWDKKGATELEVAKSRMRANFELLKKLGLERWCFHDRDIAPEGKDLKESNANLDEIVKLAKQLQRKSLDYPWLVLVVLFKAEVFWVEAGRSPDAAVFAYAAAQVKKAMQAIFLKMAVQWKKKLGFAGQLLLEPKPQEPTKHQYDWDVATTSAFLQRYGLQDEFSLNIECNHATLSGHSCHHELEAARITGMLGSIDANTGDPQTGWDTDEFLTDPVQATLVGLAIIKNGGLGKGGINFDAKLRRESIDVEDLVIAHISAIDALARGLRNAARLIKGGDLERLVEKRYSSYSTSFGAQIHGALVGFEELEAAALRAGEPTLASANQELAEMILNRYV